MNKSPQILNKEQKNGWQEFQNKSCKIFFKKN